MAKDKHNKGKCSKDKSPKEKCIPVNCVRCGDCTYIIRDNGKKYKIKFVRADCAPPCQDACYPNINPCGQFGQFPPFFPPFGPGATFITPYCGFPASNQCDPCGQYGQFGAWTRFTFSSSVCWSAFPRLWIR